MLRSERHFANTSVSNHAHDVYSAPMPLDPRRTSPQIAPLSRPDVAARHRPRLPPVLVPPPTPSAMLAFHGRCLLWTHPRLRVPSSLPCAILPYPSICPPLTRPSNHHRIRAQLDTLSATCVLHYASLSGERRGICCGFLPDIVLLQRIVNFVRPRHRTGATPRQRMLYSSIILY